MSDTVIKVENLGKKYHISHKQPEQYTALRDVMANKVKSVARKLTSPFKNHESDPSKEEFWALKDISFEVNQGEVIGIIGRNGAGKTTLLKILSRITEPTTGLFHIRGRVASLLEVGTGFHPELTGRENIFLNGAILGMTRKEIKGRFDEIVHFAEIEKFLDTPVKRYSSGMYVRLAFAVAAHLNSEILLVDEVLAVGDSEFQKKCLGKMGDIRKAGRTILLVSHNMTVVENICSRCLMIKNGAIDDDGGPRDVVSRYIKINNEIQLPPLIEREDRTGNGRLRFSSFEIISESSPTRTGQEVRFRLHYQIHRESIPLMNIAFSFSINTIDGRHLLVFSSEESNSSISCINDDGYFECVVSYLPLAGGAYSVNLYASVGGIIADYIVNAALINVDDADFYSGAGSRHSAHPPYVADHYWTHGKNNPKIQL